MSSFARLVHRYGIGLALFGVSASLPASASPGPSPNKHALTIDDVLDTERLDRATISPDGALVAAVVQRAARPGEVYGRISYETDPSRDDIWLISTKSGARRNITGGVSQAAGYWCATWSPDGRRLAVLSTKPKGVEPRGGNNVRLYVWDRTSGAMTRMSDDAVMTQTRYGSGLHALDLRGGADRGTVTHKCNAAEENAPFVWLDNRRLLAAMLPSGEISGLIDQYQRPVRAETHDAATLRAGIASTASTFGSGGAATSADKDDSCAILRIVDVEAHTLQTVASVPAYPFRGSLTVSVSPDRKRIALLATIGAMAPQAGRRFPNSWDDAWLVERRLGFVDLAAGASIRWASMPAAGRHPLELYSWSPDSRMVALRGRPDPFTVATPLFVADADSGKTTQIGPPSVDEAEAGIGRPIASSIVWINGRQLIARSTPADSQTAGSWWLLSTDGTAKDIGKSNAVVPDGFAQTADHSVIALVGKSVLRLDPTNGRLAPIAQLPSEASFIPQQDTGKPTDKFVILMNGNDGATGFASLNIATYRTDGVTVLPHMTVLDVNDAQGRLLSGEGNQQGLFLHLVDLTDGNNRELLSLNGFFRQIDWGTAKLFAYKAANGDDLKAAALLPPNYQPGRRYPTLVWVYGGYRVRALEDDAMLDPFAPGFYNLRLYSARGYVVLIPSMPLASRANRHDVYAQMPNGVMPAIDQLIAFGITDPDRLGIFGQSFGGYSVYSLVTQSDRFKAAVAMAGATNLVSHYGEFDPSARGFPGIEHEKGDNWAEMDFFGMSKLPWEDGQDYARNSPLTYVERVHTPLLMLHGSADARGQQTEAEQFFYSLYAQGKTAQFVRYGGDLHGISISPANIRDVTARTLHWFDLYVRGNVAPK